MSGETEHAFRNDGCSLFYRSWGDGDVDQPPLLLLHGLASNSTRWRELAQSLSERRGGRVLAPDLRGHGRSVFRGRLRRADWTGDIAALIDEVGCRKAVIGGHCLGANLALRFALEHPERTAALVLVEPMLPGAFRGVMARVRPLRWLLPVLALPVRALNALGVYRRRLPNLDLTELDRETRRSMAQHDSAEAMLERYARPSGDMAYMPVATYLQALYQVLRDIGPIERIEQPTLALLSGGALLADPERSRRLLEALPAVEVERIDALHWIPTEQPEAMAQAIGRFIDRSVAAD